MRARLLLILLGACATATPAAKKDEPGTVRLAADLVVRRLAPRVHVVTHEKPYPANSVVVEARDGTLVIVGSPYTAQASQRVLEWLRQEFGERKRVAIDTHFHEDAGVGGNAVYQAAGIPIHGSDLTARLLAERDKAATAPDHVFALAAGLELDFGEPVKVFFPGAGHTVDNVVVHFPQERLLVGGCLIKGGSTIGNVADADLKSWPGSVRALQGLDFEWLVPGHGERFDRGLLENTLQVLAGATKP
jgi:metallo-beta-lactamase class B